MSSHILNKDLVKIPLIGIINKHSSALLSNKGLFFLWSVNNGTPQGICCHVYENLSNFGPDIKKNY